MSFVDAQPFAVSIDEDFKTSALEFIDTVDTMLLGATTYAMARNYWPTATDQGVYGEKLNQMSKVVASMRLRDAPWGTFPAATIAQDAVANVRELKRQSGKDIWLWGSLTLMKSLFDADVVDEVQLRVCPTARGKGTNVFQDRRDMRTIEAKSFHNGVVLLRYEIKR